MCCVQTYFPVGPRDLRHLVVKHVRRCAPVQSQVQIHPVAWLREMHLGIRGCNRAEHAVALLAKHCQTSIRDFMRIVNSELAKERTFFMDEWAFPKTGTNSLVPVFAFRAPSAHFLLRLTPLCKFLHVIIGMRQILPAVAMRLTIKEQPQAWVC